MDERGHISPHYEVEEGFTPPEEDDILKLTTGVVKTVKELSDRVHKSKPNDYIDLVKVCRQSISWEDCFAIEFLNNGNF